MAFDAELPDAVPDARPLPEFAAPEPVDALDAVAPPPPADRLVPAVAEAAPIPDAMAPPMLVEPESPRLPDMDPAPSPDPAELLSDPFPVIAALDEKDPRPAVIDAAEPIETLFEIAPVPPVVAPP